MKTPIDHPHHPYNNKDGLIESANFYVGLTVSYKDLLQQTSISTEKIDTILLATLYCLAVLGTPPEDETQDTDPEVKSFRERVIAQVSLLSCFIYQEKLIISGDLDKFFQATKVTVHEAGENVTKLIMVQDQLKGEIFQALELLRVNAEKEVFWKMILTVIYYINNQSKKK